MPVKGWSVQTTVEGTCVCSSLVVLRLRAFRGWLYKSTGAEFHTISAATEGLSWRPPQCWSSSIVAKPNTEWGLGTWPRQQVWVCVLLGGKIACFSTFCGEKEVFLLMTSEMVLAGVICSCYSRGKHLLACRLIIVSFWVKTSKILIQSIFVSLTWLKLNNSNWN